jgi:transcriptional regulator with XRE-family HTH domain
MNAYVNCVEAVGPIPLLQTTTLTAQTGGVPIADVNPVSVALPPTNAPAPERRLHRLGQVRQREQITRRKVAQRLGISISDVQKQEQPSTDMLLSDLYRWQKALGVPITELLDDQESELSPPVELRAKLVRIMKTVRSLQERTKQVAVQRLIEMLVEQLVEIMPEVKDTGAWPAVGQRRKERDFGQAYYRKISTHSLDELDWFEG